MHDIGTTTTAPSETTTGTTATTAQTIVSEEQPSCKLTLNIYVDTTA